MWRRMKSPLMMHWTQRTITSSIDEMTRNGISPREARLVLLAVTQATVNATKTYEGSRDNPD